MQRIMEPFEFAEPAQLSEALALAAVPGSRLFAGGCELAHAMRHGNLHSDRLVSIMRLPDLDNFRAYPRVGIEFGAQVPIRRLLADIWVSKRWAALHEAMDQIQPPHIANMATVVGNICAASVDHDLPTALFAHRAVLQVSDGLLAKDVTIESFYPAPGRTVLEPGQMVLSIHAPPPAADAGSAFKKIARAGRHAGDAGKVNAAAYIALDPAKENIVDAVLCVGGLGSMPRRMHAAEASLVGSPAQTESYAAASAIVCDSLDFSTGDIRFDTVMSDWIRVLSRDVLEQAASRARSRHDPAEDAHLAY